MRWGDGKKSPWAEKPKPKEEKDLGRPGIYCLTQRTQRMRLLNIIIT